MSWDKFSIAQKFLQRANAIRPEDEEDRLRRDELLALQDVHYDCYMSSFNREELVKRLQAVIDGQVDLPEDTEVDAEYYRRTYIAEARVILSSVERGEVG